MLVPKLRKRLVDFGDGRLLQRISSGYWEYVPVTSRTTKTMSQSDRIDQSVDKDSRDRFCPN